MKHACEAADTQDEQVRILWDAIDELSAIATDTEELDRVARTIAPNPEAIDFPTDAPTRWDDVDDALIPLFEEPVPWFEGVYEQYELAAGGIGQICSLSPTGVEFKRFHHCDPYEGYFEQVTRRYETSETINGAQVLETRAEALDTDQRATWIRTEDERDIWFHEYVPFDARATTTEQLAAELSEIMTKHPDFETLFEETQAVMADTLV